MTFRGTVTQKYLNIGCGGRFHADWVNVDLAPTAPEVLQHNVISGLPFGSGEFDAVYHSHMLEHLGRDRAAPFLHECFRVLKHSGVIRVVVPDLEGIARSYLKWLDAAASGLEGAEANYEWAMLELYDQVVRTKSGGGMLAYLQEKPVLNIDFIRERCGDEIAKLAGLRSNSPNAGFSNRFSTLEIKKWLQNFVTRILFRGEGDLLERIRFLRTGELHLWMYDRFSLGKLLHTAGFNDIQVVSARDSRIPRWPRYELDCALDGQPHKPDSLYVEGIKP